MIKRNIVRNSMIRHEMHFARVYWRRHLQKALFSMQLSKCKLSVARNGVVCIFNHTGAARHRYSWHLSLSIVEAVINTSVTLSALCRGSVPPRETRRTTTTNNNKLARYKVRRTLSVATYLSTYPRPAFPTLSPAHLQLSRWFIAVTVSILSL